MYVCMYVCTEKHSVGNIHTKYILTLELTMTWSAYAEGLGSGDNGRWAELPSMRREGKGEKKIRETGGM